MSPPERLKRDRRSIQDVAEALVDDRQLGREHVEAGRRIDERGGGGQAGRDRVGVGVQELDDVLACRPAVAVTWTLSGLIDIGPGEFDERIAEVKRRIVSRQELRWPRRVRSASRRRPPGRPSIGPWPVPSDRRATRWSGSCRPPRRCPDRAAHSASFKFGEVATLASVRSTPKNPNCPSTFEVSLQLEIIDGQQRIVGRVDGRMKNPCASTPNTM